MKKLILTLSIAAGLFASDKLLSQKELQNVLKASFLYPRLSQDIKKGKIKVRGVLKDGFYIINVKTPRGSGDIYITKDKKYTILGNVLNNKDGQPLKAKFPVNKQTVSKGVMFTFGKGKKEIYLVTDPECPFCKKMEKEKKNVLEKNYKVHVILFPLPFHKDARAMSYYILAAKSDSERAKRMKEVLSGGDAWKKFKPTKAQKEQFDKMLSDAKKAVMELGARGTPTVYDKDFNQLNWMTLGGKK